jgi:hypothetical protein
MSGGRAPRTNGRITDNIDDDVLCFFISSSSNADLRVPSTIEPVYNLVSSFSNIFLRVDMV